uniref:Uncharacterized protein n=1 Tax=Nelumbo nucifera TaxID=4432 RepID=A0A822XG50_NELNU|nr:TPA_asm: hypothetical protein HUJ06_019459 [Nelumbo nucifera]
MTDSRSDRDDDHPPRLNFSSKKKPSLNAEHGGRI